MNEAKKIITDGEILVDDVKKKLQISLWINGCYNPYLRLKRLSYLFDRLVD